MRLIIDIGNTLVKVALINTTDDIEVFLSRDLTVSDVQAIEASAEISGVAICSVRERDEALTDYLKGRYAEFIEITASTPMPLQIKYKTPGTLGVDRLMAAVGARYYNTTDDLLVCDFGSAITFDFVSAAGEFLGGNISPGAALRFRSLNTFTKKLPLCSLDDEVPLIGTDTHSAIIGGVVNGIIYEINGYLEQLSGSNKSFSVFFTGGDGKYFADKLKKPIFVKSYLTIIGMYVVLNYNYANK